VIRTLIVDDEPLPRERIRSLLAAYPEIDVIGESRDGREAATMIAAERPDLVFLDVQMPELDAFVVIAGVSDDYLPAVIFVTAFDEYALPAFDVNAVDYVLKPINSERFDKAVRRAIEQLRAERRYASRFAVRSGSSFSFVRAEDIDWIDGADNYVRLHVSGREHLLRDTMKSIESRLQPDIFVRVHRSTIVNIDRVASVQPHNHGEYVIIMRDGARLNASRSYSDRLRMLVQNRNTRTP